MRLLPLFFLLLVGCLSSQLERPRAVMSEAIVLSQEAAPRLEKECTNALASSGEQSEALISFCDPIVADYTALRAAHKALREELERSVRNERASPKLEGLADETERATRVFRDSFAHLPTFKEPKP